MNSIKTNSINMHSIAKILSVGVAALITTTVAQANPVLLNWDSSTDGLATSAHTPLGDGVIEIGWLNAGTTEAMIDAFFAAADLASIDAVLNTVATMTFSIGSPNSFGNGLPFESFTLVSDHITNAAGFAAYKNPTTGAAGKPIYGWIRDHASLGLTTQMAFVDAGAVFGTANDTNFFSDFEANPTTTDLPNANAWVGSVVPVVFGGAIDLNGGSSANGMGLNGGANVLQLANVVPEPTTMSLVVAGLVGLVGLRRRRA